MMKVMRMVSISFIRQSLGSNGGGAILTVWRVVC